MPLINLQEESKKLIPGHKVQSISQEDFYGDYFINLLLKKDWKHTDRCFIKREHIIKLCDDMIEEMINQPTVVNLRVPIKVYGDLHGRDGGTFFTRLDETLLFTRGPQ